MKWVDKIKKTMTNCDDAESRVSHIQMEGLAEHVSAFVTYKSKDVAIAQKLCLARRCVTIPKENGTLDAINAKGEAIKVDTFPFGPAGKIKDLGQYSCGLAVQLYFHFHVDAGVSPPKPQKPAPHDTYVLSRLLNRVLSTHHSAPPHTLAYSARHTPRARVGRSCLSSSSSSRSTPGLKTRAGTFCATSAVDTSRRGLVTTPPTSMEQCILSKKNTP